MSLQFALAGMNAHINRDLPGRNCGDIQRDGRGSASSGARREDFDKVNGLLQAVEAEIKAEFATDIVALIDAAGGEVDDAVAMWNVRAGSRRRMDARGGAVVASGIAGAARCVLHCGSTNSQASQAVACSCPRLRGRDRHVAFVT
jgi:hypothetical protein